MQEQFFPQPNLCPLCPLKQVENVALMSNRPDNNYVAVNMYCDDSAMIKNLAINHRASQIAECAGKIIEVRSLKVEIVEDRKVDKNTPVYLPTLLNGWTPESCAAVSREGPLQIGGTC